MAGEAAAAGVLAAVNAVEGAVDAEIQQLDSLDEDGLGRLREQRLQQMKRDAKQVIHVCIYVHVCSSAGDYNNNNTCIYHDIVLYSERSGSRRVTECILR